MDLNKEQRYAHILQFPLLSKLEEKDLAYKSYWGCKRSRDRLFCCNLRLVFKLACEYPTTGLSYDDLFAEGSVGLWKGLLKYNPTYGTKVSSYCSWWIHQSIMKALNGKSRTIRVPAYLVQRGLRYLKADEETLTTEEIDSGKDAAEKCMPTISLQSPAGIDLQLEEVIHSDEEPVVDSLINADLLDKLPLVLNKLNPRHREIIEWRFGLTGVEALTLEDVGQRLGITRERVRQLQVIAIQKLKEELIRII